MSYKPTHQKSLFLIARRAEREKAGEGSSKNLPILKDEFDYYSKSMFMFSSYLIISRIERRNLWKTIFP